MGCPKCERDLSELENYDNIYIKHTCPGCGEELYLDYEEDVIYDDNYDVLECYDIFEWRIPE